MHVLLTATISTDLVRLIRLLPVYVMKVSGGVMNACILSCVEMIAVIITGCAWRWMSVTAFQVIWGSTVKPWLTARGIALTL